MFKHSSTLRRSSKAIYIFKEEQAVLGLTEPSLIQDVETRWNSTRRMMECICEQQASICTALVDHKELTSCMLQGACLRIFQWQKLSCNNLGEL